MRRWSGISLSPTLQKASPKVRCAFRLPGAIFLIALLPSLGLCGDNVYFQINTGTMGLHRQDLVSRYWSIGPHVGGEVGCYLEGFLSPSIGMSYTLLTPNWEEVKPEWVESARGKRSYILTGSLTLTLSDFEQPGILKHYMLLGTTLLTQRVGIVRSGIWNSPYDIGCQGGPDDRTSKTKSMVLFDIGSGFGVGQKDGAILLVQAKVSIHPNREIAFLPLELGLRF
jgi:hypothetical protein